MGNDGDAEREGAGKGEVWGTGEFRSLRRCRFAALLLKAFGKFLNSPAAQTAEIFQTTQAHSEPTSPKAPAKAPVPHTSPFPAPSLSAGYWQLNGQTVRKSA